MPRLEIILYVAVFWGIFEIVADVLLTDAAIENTAVKAAIRTLDGVWISLCFPAILVFNQSGWPTFIPGTYIALKAATYLSRVSMWLRSPNWRNTNILSHRIESPSAAAGAYLTIISLLQLRFPDLAFGKDLYAAAIAAGAEYYAYVAMFIGAGLVLLALSRTIFVAEFAPVFVLFGTFRSVWALYDVNNCF